MDGDNFSDPRRRSTRGRGNRGGGARGARGGRGPSRGARGTSGSRGGRGRGAKRGGMSRRKAEDLGSNAYRYKEPEEVEDEDEFEVGMDIEQAAAGSMKDDPHADAYKLDDDPVLDLLSVNVEKMEKALASIPLWVRLGEVSRFALGIADDDLVENYLEPFEDGEEPGSGKEMDEKAVDDEFSEALAGLNFDDDEEQSDNLAGNASNPENSTTKSVSDTLGRDNAVKKVLERKVDDGVASTGVGEAGNPVENVAESRADQLDDFDEWLDDV